MSRGSRGDGSLDGGMDGTQSPMGRRRRPLSRSSASSAGRYEVDVGLGALEDSLLTGAGVDWESGWANSANSFSQVHAAAKREVALEDSSPKRPSSVSGSAVGKKRRASRSLAPLQRPSSASVVVEDAASPKTPLTSRSRLDPLAVTPVYHAAEDDFTTPKSRRPASASPLTNRRGRTDSAPADTSASPVRRLGRLDNAPRVDFSSQPTTPVSNTASPANRPRLPSLAPSPNISKRPSSSDMGLLRRNNPSLQDSQSRTIQPTVPRSLAPLVRPGDLASSTTPKIVPSGSDSADATTPKKISSGGVATVTTPQKISSGGGATTTTPQNISSGGGATTSTPQNISSGGVASDESSLALKQDQLRAVGSFRDESHRPSELAISSASPSPPGDGVVEVLDRKVAGHSDTPAVGSDRSNVAVALTGDAFFSGEDDEEGNGMEEAVDLGGFDIPAPRLDLETIAEGSTEASETPGPRTLQSVSGKVMTAAELFARVPPLAEVDEAENNDIGGQVVDDDDKEISVDREDTGRAERKQRLEEVEAAVKIQAVARGRAERRASSSSSLVANPPLSVMDESDADVRNAAADEDKIQQPPKIAPPETVPKTIARIKQNAASTGKKSVPILPPKKPPPPSSVDSLKLPPSAPAAIRERLEKTKSLLSMKLSESKPENQSLIPENQSSENQGPREPKASSTFVAQKREEWKEETESLRDQQSQQQQPKKVMKREASIHLPTLGSLPVMNRPPLARGQSRSQPPTRPLPSVPQSKTQDVSLPGQVADPSDPSSTLSSSSPPPPIKSSPEGACSQCLAAGSFAAHKAAFLGHELCLGALASGSFGGEAGSKLSAADDRGRSPLFYAAARGHTACSLLLVDMQPQWLDCGDGRGDTAVMVAAARGNAQVLGALLQSGARPDLGNQLGLTAAHVARDKSCLELVLEYGALPNAVDKEGRSPLFVCCAAGHDEAAKQLLEAHAGSRVLNLSDTRGDTPLHAAAANGHAPCVELLLHYSADPTRRNKAGMRPIDLATNNGHQACAALLRPVSKTAAWNRDETLNLAEQPVSNEPPPTSEFPQQNEEEQPVVYPTPLPKITALEHIDDVGIIDSIDDEDTIDDDDEDLPSAEATIPTHHTSPTTKKSSPAPNKPIAPKKSTTPEDEETMLAVREARSGVSESEGESSDDEEQHGPPSPERSRTLFGGVARAIQWGISRLRSVRSSAKIQDGSKHKVIDDDDDDVEDEEEVDEEEEVEAKGEKEEWDEGTIDQVGDWHCFQTKKGETVWYNEKTQQTTWKTPEYVLQQRRRRKKTAADTNW